MILKCGVWRTTDSSNMVGTVINLNMEQNCHVMHYHERASYEPKHHSIVSQCVIKSWEPENSSKQQQNKLFSFLGISNSHLRSLSFLSLLGVSSSIVNLTGVLPLATPTQSKPQTCCIQIGTADRGQRDGCDTLSGKQKGGGSLRIAPGDICQDIDPKGIL